VRLTFPDPGPRRFGVVRPERWLVGEVVALTADTLAVRPHPLLPPVGVPRSALRRIEVSRGSPSRWWNAGSGAVEGTLLGVLWGHILYDAGVQGRGFATQAQARAHGAVVGAVTGALARALFPYERWRRVPLE
jgi:uncharacterized protein YcfJ